MAKYELMIFSAILVAVTIKQTNAIKCYRCSTDATNSEFCADPFDEQRLQKSEKMAAYVDCDYQSGSPLEIPTNIKKTCKKLKQLINDKTVVSRSCYWEDITADSRDCQKIDSPGYIKTLFCETCDRDGCNGAIGYGPIAALIIISSALATLSSL